VWAYGPGNPHTNANALGAYTLNEENGMKYGEYYDCLYSECDRNDTTFGGHKDGRIYYDEPDIRIDVDITYPKSNCNITK